MVMPLVSHGDAFGITIERVDMKMKAKKEQNTKKENHRFHYRPKLMMLSLLMAFSLLVSACGQMITGAGVEAHEEGVGSGLRIGFTNPFLASQLFTTTHDATLYQMGHSGDVGMGLLGGGLDVGFLEVEQLVALARENFMDDLAVIGTINYPFGATVLLRDGLDLRLSEINGKRLGVASLNDQLLHTFLEDTARLEVEIDAMELAVLPYDAMVSALSEGAIDVALVPGHYSFVALSAGHSILYQNWDMEAGDECCPAIVDQAALVVLARQEALADIEPFVQEMVASNELRPSQVREVIMNQVSLTTEVLQGIPVSSFEPWDNALVDVFLNNRHLHHDHH